MAKECCEKVNEQPGSCNPCCIPLLRGVRAVAVTDIVISIILIIVALVLIAITDFSLFLLARSILFFIFVIASFISSMLVLALVQDHCWPCLLWAVVNGFRLIIDLVYYFVMVAEYRRGRGHFGFPLADWVFALFTIAFLFFLALYIWFVIIMLAYASYINRKSLLENQALAFQKATEEDECPESCIPTPCPTSVCSVPLYTAGSSYCPPYPCSTLNACQSIAPHALNFYSSSRIETIKNYLCSSSTYKGSCC